MYKADSKIAEEFIDHQEILDTLGVCSQQQKQSCPDRATD